MKGIRLLSTVITVIAIGGPTALHAQDDHGRGRGHADDKQPPGQQGRVSDDEQKRRVQEEQQRAAEYRQHLDQQVRVVQQQNAQLQEQQRLAQYRAQQEYAAQLQRQQQEQLQRAREARDYSRDPYITTPHIYRYNVDGAYRQTNEYGATVLRQAVNNGYQQGYRTGQADRADRWAPNYQNSPAYRDASYGFSGNYVDLSDYRYYFREGFVRGYNDGYDAQLRYGSYSNGSTSILGSVLSSILGFTTIH